MGTITKKKFFSETAPFGATNPTNLAAIMKTAGWGFEKDADNNITTQPNLDSFTGTAGTITPAANLYFGYDRYVRNADAVGPPRLYKGVLAAANEVFRLEEFCRGVVDANRIWMYSPGGDQELEIVFKGI